MSFCSTLNHTRFIMLRSTMHNLLQVLLTLLLSVYCVEHLTVFFMFWFFFGGNSSHSEVHPASYAVISGQWCGSAILRL